MWVTLVLSDFELQLREKISTPHGKSFFFCCVFFKHLGKQTFDPL